LYYGPQGLPAAHRAKRGGLRQFDPQKTAPMRRVKLRQERLGFQRHPIGDQPRACW
jgi:hypothetical protein